MIAVPPPAIVRIAKDEVPKAEVWTLDQLRIERATESAKVDQLAAAHSIRQAMEILRQQHVPFVQARATLRPDKLPANVRTAIVALPEGEPFVLPDGDFISINVIVGGKPAPAAIVAPPQASLPSSEPQGLKP